MQRFLFFDRKTLVSLSALDKKKWMAPNVLHINKYIMPLKMNLKLVNRPIEHTLNYCSAIWSKSIQHGDKYFFFCIIAVKRDVSSELFIPLRIYMLLCYLILQYFSRHFNLHLLGAETFHSAHNKC